MELPRGWSKSVKGLSTVAKEALVKEVSARVLVARGANAYLDLSMTPAEYAAVLDCLMTGLPFVVEELRAEDEERERSGPVKGDEHDAAGAKIIREELGA